MPERYRGESWARAHFRLTYAWYNQNAYPRVGITFYSNGYSKVWTS